MKKKAIITGIYGQDGSYLAELLSSKNYEIHGIGKYPPSENSARIYEHLKALRINHEVQKCDLNNYADVLNLVRMIKPDEIYHLAATHYSSDSSLEQRNALSRKLYEDNVISTLNIVHSIYEASRSTKLVLASTCMIFDNSKILKQDEMTIFTTKSIYGLSRIVALDLVRFYRNQYGLHVSVAILYNHESPRRTELYVTQKIAKNVVRIRRGEISHFSLGDLSSKKDWGYAKDYIYGIWLMAQQDRPDDYIIATGEGHTVGEFVEFAFSSVGIDNWRRYVKLDGSIVSRTDSLLIGNPEKIRRRLNWACSTDFKGLVEIMVRAAENNSLG